MSTKSDRTVVHPPAFISNFDTVLTAIRKGGAGKSFTATFVASCALMRGANIRVFEIDQQQRLEQMFRGLVTQVDLPNTEQLMDDDTSESRALAQVYSAMCSPKETGMVLVDIGANFDERVARGLSRTNLHKRIGASGRRVCILVPFDGGSDSITAAASVVEQFAVALPDAHFVFVQREADLKINMGPSSSLSEEAKIAFRRTIEPLHTRERILNIGQMRKGVHKAFLELTKSPLDFMDCPPEVIGEAGSTVANSTREEQENVGYDLLGQFEEFLGHVDQEVQRVLGFRTASTPAPKAE